MIVRGVEYEVIRELNVPGFPGRVEFYVRRPRGKTKYHVVRYEDGSFSSIVRSPF